MPARPCRSSRSSEATCAVEHVALRDRDATNALSLMSLRTVAWGDMLRSACRSERAGRATLASMQVALHARVRRHVRAGVSPCTSSPGDMQGPQRRSAHGSGATCSRGHVAPRAWEMRRGSGCSVAGALVQGGMHPLACRAARAGQATGAGPIGDMHERECRFSRESDGASCDRRGEAPSSDGLDTQVRYRDGTHSEDLHDRRGAALDGRILVPSPT
jgi:hypothetical protein